MRPGLFITVAALVALLLPAAPVSADVEVEEPVRLSGAGAVPGTAGIAHHRAVTALDGYAVAAWLEAVPSGGDQVMARTREPDGAWSPAVQLSSTTTGTGTASVAAFTLATNGDGDAVVAWRQQDTFDNDPETMVFASTLDRGGAAWSRSRVGGQEHGVSIFHTPSAAVLPDGTAVVGWTGYADEERSTLQIYANEGDESGWGTQTLISDTGDFPVICEGCEYGDSTNLSLAADGAGNVRALFLNEAEVSDGGGGTTQRLWILANSRAPGGGWASATPITSVQDPYTQPGSPVIAGDRSAAGFAQAWSVPATDSAPAGVRLAYDGVVRIYRHTSSSLGLSGLAVAGGQAVGLLAYAEDSVGHLLVVDIEEGDADWGEPSDPASEENLSNGPTPRLALSPDGRVTIVWTNGSTRRVRITQRPPGSAAWDNPRTMLVSTSSQALPALGTAEDGSGTVIWRSPVDGVPAVIAARFAPEQVEPEPPTLTMTAPTKLLTRAPSWTVGWQATDEGGGVGTVEVGESVTRWDEDADTTAEVEEHTGETSYGVMVDAGEGAGVTSCYAARGYATSGATAGEWASPRCVVTPVDDRTLTRVGSDWSRKTGDGRWDRTYLQTDKKGAKLRLPDVHANTVGLLVERGPGFGKVKVVFDGMPLGTVDLAGAKKKRVVVMLEDFPTTRFADLVIKVVSANGKRVRIDGVYAGQVGDEAFTD